VLVRNHLSMSCCSQFQLKELHDRREDDRLLAPAAQSAIAPEDSSLPLFGERDPSSLSASFHWGWQDRLRCSLPRCPTLLLGLADPLTRRADTVFNVLCTVIANRRGRRHSALFQLRAHTVHLWAGLCRIEQEIAQHPHSFAAILVRVFVHHDFHIFSPRPLFVQETPGLPGI
jgi:hypothetical protein